MPVYLQHCENKKPFLVHSLRSGDNRALCQFRAEVELGAHSRATIFCGQFHQIDRELKGKNDLKTILLYYSSFVLLPFVHKVFNYAAFHRLYSPGWFVYNPSRRFDTPWPTATVLIFCRQFRQISREVNGSNGLETILLIVLVHPVAVFGTKFITATPNGTKCWSAFRWMIDWCKNIYSFLTDFGGYGNFFIVCVLAQLICL